jgi:hypothetical protein
MQRLINLSINIIYFIVLLARRTSPKKRGRTSDKKSPTGPETWEQPTADVLGSPVLDDSAVHKNTKKTLPGESKRMEDVSRKLFPLEELATSGEW